MNNSTSIGKRIAQYRKNKQMTQEDLAQALGISSQAVSKWETDVSCPDISVLVQLSDILGVKVDQLLRGDGEPQTQFVPEASRKNPDQMLMRIVIDSADGDKVRVNLPLTLIRASIELGAKWGVAGEHSDLLSQVDFMQLLSLVDAGVMGKLVEIESADGDSVEIWVE